MNTTISIKKFIFSIIALGLVTSCVNDDDFSVPNIECQDQSLSATKTIEDIYAVSSATTTQYTADDIIEAYVVSSDEGGNFFKTISFQSLDPNQRAFSVPVDVEGLYANFEPGRKVYIKLKDLYTAIDFDQLEIGQLFVDPDNGDELVGRISAIIYSDILERSCEVIDEALLVNRISVKDVSDAYLNKLVEFTDVQFVDAAVGKTFYDENNDLGGATNWNLTDELGYEVIFRTSSFANFASRDVPEGRGTVRGVLTKFRNDYQLLARSLTDVNISGQRETLERIGIDVLRQRFNGSTTTIADTRYIEGVITLSGYVDGNVNQGSLVARNAIIQDETGGILLRFDADAHQLIEGDRVRVRVNGYSLGTFSGLLQISNIDFDGTVNGKPVVEVLGNGPLPAPVVLSVEDLATNGYESQLVQVENVQFIGDDQGLTYNGNRTLTNCNSNIVVFTRSGATYSGTVVASGNGNFTGIATNFNGTAQLYMRNLDGVYGLTGPRCSEPAAFFFENFESLTSTGNNQPVALPGWVSVSVNGGTELWEARSFNNNKYAQASAFGIAETMNVWLVTPALNLDEYIQETLRFSYTQNFYNGDALKVLISTNYDGVSANLNAFTWTDITAQAGVTQRSTNGFMNSFAASERIDLSTYTGTVYIAFVYEGASTGVTTNVQIDNVEVRGVAQ